MNYVQIKRAEDVLLSALLLILCAPVFLCVAFAILLDDGKPIFFHSERIGRHGCKFWMVIFRSMEHGSKLVPSAFGSDLKITKVGKFIRRFSFDELPQLFNVFLGDMSLIGPRPALPAQSKLTELRKS